MSDTTFSRSKSVYKYVCVFILCVCVLECRQKFVRVLRGCRYSDAGIQMKELFLLRKIREVWQALRLLWRMATVWAWWLLQAKWQFEQWQEEGSHSVLWGNCRWYSLTDTVGCVWQEKRGLGGRWGLGKASWGQIIGNLSGTLFFGELRFLRRENRIVYAWKNVASAGRV